MKKFALIASVILVTLLMTITFSVAEEQNIGLSLTDSTPAYSYYGSFKGSVEKIETLDGNTLLTVKKDESVANMVIYGSTLVLNRESLAAGETVTGYYEADQPMIMIYPPRYNLSILQIGEAETEFVKADLFDDKLLSRDKALKLITDDATPLLSQDGTEYKGSLKNRKLVAFYNESTAGVPAETTPKKVIVMDEEAPADQGSLLVKVNGENTGFVAVMADGTLMLPVRPIAERLGFTVSWDQTARAVGMISGASAIRFKIGGTGCKSNIGTPEYIFQAAPFIIDSRTYVPISFFKEILGCGVTDTDEISITTGISKR
jgi:hypothetical protein